MRRLIFGGRVAAVSLLALLAIATNIEAVTPRKAAAQPPFKITAVKAMLFFDEKGTFSDDLLTQPNLALWNTIIGEGSAGSPSNSTLVLVEVSGKYNPDEAAPNRKVEFTATAAGKVLLRKSADIRIGEKGKYYAAFWLYDTGCDKIKLSARLTGQTQPSSMTKTIPFQCGE
ncbi:MAG TPA: hypothetical protein VEV81_12610 [Pyrinomonadaceae bacterium]|nr:hypothetical protein [Pyrinomonadaceae bacterium]